MTLCNWCDADVSKQSYFIRVGVELLEVCPECHHHHAYAPPDLLEKYKKRRDIK